MKNKIKFCVRTGLIISFSLLLASVSFSQDTQNFSGIWTFNESRSTLEEGGSRMVSPTIIINQEGNNFRLEKSFRRQDGSERKMTETYTLDGKESANPVFNTSKKSITQWSADKKSLTVTSLIKFEMDGETNEIKTIEVYDIEEDGKTLSIDYQLTSTLGERKNLLIYIRKQ